jgi:hypothetical protein
VHVLLHAQWDLPSRFCSILPHPNIIEEEIFLYEHNFLNLGAFSFLIESLPNPPNFGNLLMLLNRGEMGLLIDCSGEIPFVQ